MPDHYRIIVERISSNKKKEEEILIEDMEVGPVDNIFGLGFRHDKQIELLQKLQDALLAMQTEYLCADIELCPRCGNKLSRQGFEKSDFHSVFTDHKVKTRRLKCNKCDWKSIRSIKSLFGTNIHPDLGKLQCEVGANHSYRAGQEIMNRKSAGKRRVNNHDRIKHVVEAVGREVEKNNLEETAQQITTAKKSELIVQVDGGHLRNKDSDSRSFEALTAVVYAPESVEKVGNSNRGKIYNKSCAASALNDNQVGIKKQTLLAAKKQGLTKETNITAICDGAVNCWNIINSLKSHCNNILPILDWFHIAKRFENLALKKYNNKIKRIKWHLWHGNPDRALTRINELTDMIDAEKEKNKLSTLYAYINNNKKYVVNYRERKKQGLVFTSNVAESNVESLINQRCKRKQHMIWSRLGAHLLLQIRAIIASNDWIQNWENYVFKGLTKPVCCQ